MTPTPLPTPAAPPEDRPAPGEAPVALDDDQRAAVEHGDGPLLVVAGAGTGKTTVIARRIAHLVTTGRARPSEILALTFNDKAAAEMQERVDLLVPYGYSDVRVATFHAFGEEVLAGHGLEVGIAPGSTVLDKTAQALFLAERIEKLPLRRYAPLSDPTRYLHALADYFSRAKDEPWTAEELQTRAEARLGDPDPAARDQAERELELALAYQAYNRMLWEAGFLDFGDLLALTHRLFEESPAVLRRFQERFRYVLVDEFQDTNPVQFKIVRRLVERHRNLVVVGDDDQSIYRFRGAHLKNILEFRQHYPGTREIVLRNNYRSTREILTVARRLILMNRERLEVRYGIAKELTAHSRGVAPQCREFATEAEEARWVADAIERGVADGRRSWRDHAILVRTNEHAEPFLRALDERGISYWFSGSRGLFQRPEVKQLVALLQSLYQDSRPEHLYLLASEGYGVPDEDLGRLMHLLKDTPGTLRGLFRVAARGGVADLSEEGIARIGELLRDLDELESYAKGRRTGEVLYRYLDRRGVLRDLMASRSYEDEGRARNLVKFFHIIRSFEKVALADRVALFLRHLEAIQQYGEDPAVADLDATSNVVQVLTIHKAKGLEFPVVFLVQAATDRFPTKYRSRSPELPSETEEPGPTERAELSRAAQHREEERRLCYVAFTRAREELIATYARDYGTPSERTRSLFLSEAFDLGKPVSAKTRRRAVEMLEENKEREAPPEAPRQDSGVPLALSFRRLDDYASCPLRYRFLHVLGVGAILPPDPRVNFGQAVHRAAAFALARRMAGAPPALEETLEMFRASWRCAGHLSPEHEAARFQQGVDALRRFHEREIEAGPMPAAVERPFRIGLDDVLLTGRIDRVDEGAEGTVLVDYKTAEMDDEERADQRAKEDLQLSVYALAWREMTGRMPDRVELRFVTAGTSGRAAMTDARIEKTRETIAAVAASIRAGEFQARPSEYACRRCACRPICRESAV
ncbi:MAG TPA: ATP-dependent DNA helicase [Candidatus Eisenbacteria bacterium]|nr:ATP-dependent DNA helicase [Candidatus Eisenbacteria bacterium]